MELSKNRHGLNTDIDNFTQDYLNRRLPGDAVRGVGGLPVKEHRMRDSSSGRGKSGGFRVYYYYNETLIFLVFVFLRRELPRDIGARIQRVLRDSGLLDR